MMRVRAIGNLGYIGHSVTMTEIIVHADREPERICPGEFAISVGRIRSTVVASAHPGAEIKCANGRESAPIWSVLHDRLSRSVPRTRWDRLSGAGKDVMDALDLCLAIFEKNPLSRSPTDCPGPLVGHLTVGRISIYVPVLGPSLHFLKKNSGDRSRSNCHRSICCKHSTFTHTSQDFPRDRCGYTMT